MPFITSSFIGALAWVLLGLRRWDPQPGLRYIGGDGVLLNIYSTRYHLRDRPHEVPFIFLMVAGALRSMDPSLEEASLSSGAGTWETATKVTLPLVLPAILAGSLVVFRARGGTVRRSGGARHAEPDPRSHDQHRLHASLLSAPARPRRRAIRDLAGDRPVRPVPAEDGAPRTLLHDRRREELASTAGSTWTIPLGAVRHLHDVLLLAVILPFATIFVSSIRTIWTSYFSWEQFTLEHYRWVFSSIL